ncbi:sugar transferase [Acidicapsa dinghuensis]|uniref:Sugar transferase n=1 Tax=Acidicapsa dinghuensis TaxID=2218256 RepID=A0ABW1EMD3_9BACT|nr:sugar transferase [Acidicapsa dinghuensis]
MSGFLFGGCVIKRLVDVILSASLLLFFSPVLACAVMMIRLTSPGPAIFRQTRVGRGFQPFEILKLRTMAQDRPGLAYTLASDPRITPVGRFLREAKIDELPQLWNVLRGDMSLVGPRPVVPEISLEFRPHYEHLLRVRPGLTDPASIKYRHEARLLAAMPDGKGYFKSVVTPDKLRISADYLERATLWTDGVTMAMTAVVCCFPRLCRLYGLPPAGSDGMKNREQREDSKRDGAILAHAQSNADTENLSHLPVWQGISLSLSDFLGTSTSTMPN